MLEERETIGERVKRYRLRLGLTQADLAAELGRSQGWVSKVERGLIELDSAALINRLASALHVHPNDLIARPYISAPEENRWQVSASTIVRELRRYDLAPVFDGRPASSAALWKRTRQLHALRDAALNSKVLELIPDLLRESRALAEAAAGREREEAYAVYAVACKFAHTAAHSLGHPELVAIAAERATWAADRSGDPVLPAVAAWMRMWDMWTTEDYADALALGAKAQHMLDEPYHAGEPLALRAWGAIALRAAVSAARSGAAEQASGWITVAGEAATRLEPAAVDFFDRHSLTFSAGNVAVHGVSVAIEVGEHDRALALAERSDPRVIAALPASRQGHHHMDLAKCRLWTGDREKALAELQVAERIAPQLVRNHPVARATLRSLVYAERVSLREALRGMSQRFHLD
ncbi:transcriptional regulator [Actinomadura craniellae]|uniref:Transcriptional regulator n=1 Tax=Actinomadura craniellae TaxID=2231787 RepID=A0A365HD35_9ACTN|nr:helix-turn-helix transcriptional regulator [Actinomadura craniellae]RAY17021.1 transcriptional regulator [Actinomadura craniellae]